MTAARVVLAAAILLMGVWANFNPDVIDGWVDDGIAVQSDEPVSLVGLQEEEEWLIVRVQFPGKPFLQSKANSMLGGDGSAASYIEQMSGSGSSLVITEASEIWTSPHPEGHWGADSNEERDIGVTSLIEESVETLLVGTDLSRWDFDSDGTVDRLLILHSGGLRNQEVGPMQYGVTCPGLTSPLRLGTGS